MAEFEQDLQGAQSTEMTLYHFSSLPLSLESLFWCPQTPKVLPMGSRDP